ncbi:MAG: recombinase family protein, partial [Acidobacteria bacterium]|nr:recombinase family protein [Acidobacteriota bacterium]
MPHGARVPPFHELDTDARASAGVDHVVRASISHSSFQRWIHCRRTAHARSAVENARHPALLVRFVEQTPAGNVPMQDVTRILGVSRQAVLQRVKRGELDAVHVHHGKRKGLRI